MTTIFQSAAASTGSASTLQTAYVAGNTISVTDAEGIVALSSAAASTVAVETITTDATASGAALEITNNGSGNALLIKDGANSVLTISPVGAITGVGSNNGTTVGSNISFTAGAAVAGVGGNASLVGGAGATGGGGLASLRGGAGSGAAGGNTTVLGGAGDGAFAGGGVTISGGTSSTGKPGTTNVTSSRAASTGAGATDGPVLVLTQSGTSGATTSIFTGTADPSTGSGVVAPEGSLYIRDGGTVGGVYLKYGAADTAWTSMDAQPMSNVQGAGYAFAAKDIGNVVFATGAGAQAFTLPTLAAFILSGRMALLTVQCEGAATAVTITPGAGSQINGAGLGVAYAVAIGRSRLTLFSRDGLAWFTG